MKWEDKSDLLCPLNSMSLQQERLWGKADMLGQENFTYRGEFFLKEKIQSVGNPCSSFLLSFIAIIYKDSWLELAWHLHRAKQKLDI